MSAAEEAQRKTALLEQLREERRRLGNPSFGKIAALSEKAPELYPSRAIGRSHPSIEVRLVRLASPTMSAILGGERKGLPRWPWVASFVVCCQRLSYDARFIPTDPGRDGLAVWAEHYRRAEGTARRGPKLPRHALAFLATFGAYARNTLAAEMERQTGDPDITLRASVLFASDPGYIDLALALLMRETSSQHAATIKLADAIADVADPSAIIVRYARELAAAATSEDEAAAFTEAADRAAHRRPPARAGN
jgi:hypothetical protein